MNYKQYRKDKRDRLEHKMVMINGDMFSSAIALLIVSTITIALLFYSGVDNHTEATLSLMLINLLCIYSLLKIKYKTRYELKNERLRKMKNKKSILTHALAFVFGYLTKSLLAWLKRKGLKSLFKGWWEGENTLSKS